MEATFDNKTNLLAANVRSFVDDSILYNITTSHNLWGRTVTLLKDANPALGSKSPIVGAIYWRERLFEVNGHRKSISDIKTKPPGFVPGVHPQPKSKPEGNHSKTREKDDQKKRGRARDASKVRDNIKSKDRKSKTRSRDPKKKRAHKREAKLSSAVALVPGCTLCLSIVRRSSVLISELGLGDWWRTLTCNTRHWRWSADRTEYQLVYHHEQWKALTNLENEDDEKGSGGATATDPARPGHTRTRTVSTTFGARDSATISPGRNSGFSATNKQQQQQSRHSTPSSTHLSLSTTARLSASSTGGKDDDEKRPSEEEVVDPEKAEEDRRTSASLYIPYRSHLFHKTKPAVLKMKQKALLEDEVFLLLVLVYSETKRQDKTNSSGEW